jgi:hypothetical protein
MKTISLYILFAVILILKSNAQFKILSNGEVRLWTNNMGPYDNSMITYANNDLSKAYVIDRVGIHKFFVEGRGRCYATGYYTMSDSTLKYQIEPINNALSKVLNLNGVTYYFKNDDVIGGQLGNISSTNPSNISSSSKIESIIVQTKSMGLIAQNVKLFVPEAVDTLENGKLAVSYDAIIGLLIESIKEQQSQIELMKTLAFSQEQDILRLKEIYEIYILSNGKKSSSLGSSEDTSAVITEKEFNMDKARLYENLPNPFTSDTKIAFYIPVGSAIANLIIHDLQGVEVKSFTINPNVQSSITINGSELKAGMYLYSLLIDNKIIDTKRMILTKE